ncbi:MAG TPA: ABC transporter ATP-binding protein [Terriglobales bacterium]
MRFASQTETHALKEISMSVAAGQVLGLLGPNGSGKSTMLKLISTVLLPDRGRVLVDDYDTRTQGQAVRRTVGFAIATERSFFPRLTVRENLEFFAALEDIPRREIPHRATDVLLRVNLIDEAHKQTMKLSSGMQQRLGIARALIKSPSILLLDEPSRSLDAAACEEMWTWIRDLSEDGTTVLLASHNFEEVSAVCDRAALLCAGELLDCMNIRSVPGEELRNIYFEMTKGQRKTHLAIEVPA